MREDTTGTQQGRLQQVHAIHTTDPVAQVGASQASVDLNQANSTRCHDHLYTVNPSVKTKFPATIASTAGYLALVF
jgi:hypothetical protein